MAEARIARIQYSLASAADIKEKAVQEITTRSLYDKESFPKPCGLNTLMLGPIRGMRRCGTCGLTAVACTGHSGYISLHITLFHISHIQPVVKVLRCICYWCSASIVTSYARTTMSVQKRLTKHRVSKTCPQCKGPQPNYSVNFTYLLIYLFTYLLIYLLRYVAIFMA